MKVDAMEEDVVLTGSPLYDFLHTNEVQSSLLNETEEMGDYQHIVDDNIGNGKFAQEVESSKHGSDISTRGCWQQNMIKTFFNMWKKLSLLLGISCDSLSKQNENYQRQYMQAIFSSKCLLEDDFDYICLKFPHLLLTAEGRKRNIPQTNMNQRDIFLKCSHLFVAVLSIAVCLTACQTLWIQLSVIALGSVIILYQLHIMFRISAWSRMNANNLQTLKSFLRCSEELQDLIDKCIRLIQEMEIAAMGYTLITGKTPINRLERSKQKMARECVQLRHLVITTSVESILSCRNASLHLLSEGCLLRSFEENSQIGLYMCEITLQDLGPCFDKKANFDELALATDNFCLDILRDTNRFLRQQRSEFMRLLTLTIFNAAQGYKPNVNPLLKSVEDSVKTLKQSYNAHLSLQHHTKQLGQKPQSRSPTVMKNPVQIAVHSLGVHLRAALNITMQSEEYLEENKLGNDILDLQDGFLQQIKIHLGASNQCMNEAMKQLNPDANTTDGTFKPGDLKPPTPVLKGVDEQYVDDSLLQNKQDFTEDQVFEGIPEDNVDDTSVDGPGDNNDFEVDRKNRINETVHVMQELKSVLHVKTSEEEREIRKSKLFPEYKPKLPPQDAKQSHVSMESQPVKTLQNSPDTFEISVKTVNDDEANENEDSRKAEEGNSMIGNGEMPVCGHKFLKITRRPRPPGKTRHRSKNIRNSESLISKPEGISASIAPDITRNKENHSSEEEESTVTLGFGVSSILASQAAKIALSNRININAFHVTSFPEFSSTGEETTFGNSDEDSS